MTATDLVRKPRNIFIKIVLTLPSTLHSTLTSAWLGLAIGTMTDLRSVRITNHVETRPVRTVQLQEY